MRFQSHRDNIIPYKPWKNFTMDVNNICTSVLPSKFVADNYFKHTKKKKKDSSGTPIKNKQGEFIYIQGKGVRVSLHDDTIVKDAVKKNEQKIRPHVLTLNTEDPKYYWAKAGKGSNYRGFIYSSDDGDKVLKVVNILNTTRGNTYTDTLTKKKKMFTRVQKLHPKQRVLFYEKNKEELKELLKVDKSKLQGRMFDIQELRQDGRIIFRKSICASTDEKPKSVVEIVDGMIKDNILKLSSKNWDFICERQDFILDMTGNIQFLF